MINWKPFHGQLWPLKLRTEHQLFHSLLKICTDVRRVTRPLKRVRRRTSNEIVRVVCASIILRHRNQEMNLLQKIISVILHRGGAAKQVSSNISHTNRCNNCI